jgi:hypothetical protein
MDALEDPQPPQMLDLAVRAPQRTTPLVREQLVERRRV